MAKDETKAASNKPLYKFDVTASGGDKDNKPPSPASFTAHDEADAIRQFIVASKMKQDDVVLFSFRALCSEDAKRTSDRGAVKKSRSDESGVVVAKAAGVAAK